MMTKTVRYADLECLLAKLGFRPGVTTGPQQLLEYPDYEALIVLPPHQDDEAVPSWHILGARKLCDAKGIIESDEFDRMLEAITEETDCTPQAA